MSPYTNLEGTRVKSVLVSQKPDSGVRSISDKKFKLNSKYLAKLKQENSMINKKSSNKKKKLTEIFSWIRLSEITLLEDSTIIVLEIACPFL